MKQAVRTLLVSALVALAVSGCAKTDVIYFVPPPGVGDLQANADLMECNLLARGLAPNIAPIPPPQPASGAPSFASGFSQGLANAAFMGTMAAVAKARREEGHARITCMRLRGYRIENRAEEHSADTCLPSEWDTSRRCQE